MIKIRMIQMFKFIQSKQVVILLLIWLFALVWGYSRGIHNAGFGSGYYINASQLRISVLTFALSEGVSFSVSALAAFFIPFALFLLAFTRSYFYGMALACIQLAFGSADWLVLPLLCFTETLSIPIYLWFWSNRLQQGSAVSLKKLFIAASALILVFVADCCVVSPFFYRVVCYL